MIGGKLVWLHAEDPYEDISIVLIILEQLSTSVLFKDILEAISLILCYRTTCWLDLEYSLTFTTLDAHSIFILLSTMDCYLEVKNLSRRQTVFFLPVDPRDEDHKDPEYIGLLCTTSRERHAQCMEETLRRGILGRYWFLRSKKD